MTDSSNAPVDLRIKHKRAHIDDNKLLVKKKSRHNNDIPLDLSIKSCHDSSQYSMITPYYNPTNLCFNSSALLYDLFLTNLNTYSLRQQQQQQQRSKIESTSTKSIKQPTIASCFIKDNSAASKRESYACSCGEKYSNVAQLVSHLKITNHNAQLSSTHDEVAKLVRGQDIWLSRDTNPANQILKCLRCSLSFETLPDLTAHVMKTNHFTQLLPSSSTSYQQSISKQQQYSPTKLYHTHSRLTCLICSQQFPSEVDLIDHLQRLHQVRFNCTTCGMYFENEDLYKQHLVKEMHHRNGKGNRLRDHFTNQCKFLQRQSLFDNMRTEQRNSPSSIDKEVECVTYELIDRIVSENEITTNDALSLLQNFVIQQTSSKITTALSSSSSTLSSYKQNIEVNSDDETSNQSVTNLSDEKLLSSHQIISNENPLVSLEKMLIYSTTAIGSPSRSLNAHRSKKKNFEKYRLFAEQMIRST